ncbi:MAG: AI-2E family transporter [Ruminococcaceae bacterium]|nr:AI-2E family transporter [Oscillospiraceae bacterium]
MKFFEPNEKRNTVALYVFLVALFCVFCVIIGINISVVPKIADFIFEVVKPIIYGFVIAFLLHPLVRFTETKILGNRKEKKIGFRHFLSVVIVYVVVIALITLFCMTVIPEIISNYDKFSSKFMQYVESFQHRTAELVTSLTGESVYVYYDVMPDLRKDAAEQLFAISLRNPEGYNLVVNSGAGAQIVKNAFDGILASLGEMINNSLPNIFSSALTIITETKNLIIGIFLSLYLLIGEKKHIERIQYICKVWLPERAYKNLCWIVRKSKSIFRDYIVVRLLDGMIIGILMFICLFIFQTPYAVLLAVVMGVSSFFPFIGPIIGIGAGTFILLLVDVRYALLYLVISVLINILDSRYIEPFLNAGRQDNLPAIWVFSAIIVMGGFFGIVGILIGIPFVALVYSIFKALCEKKLREKGLSDRTQAYFENAAVETSDADYNIEEGTNMSTYLVEKRDDAQVYNEMKDKLSKKTDKAKRVYSKLKSLFKRK